MWIFSTREFAITIYFTLFIVLCLFSNEVRSKIIILIKSALSPKLVKAVFVFLIYASIFVLIFALTPIWKWIYLKDILIWVIFAGIPLCFKSTTTNLSAGYFRNIVFDQFKFVVFVEFIINSFTFSLITELFLVLFAAFITILDAIAGTKEEYKRIKALTSSILVIIGLLIFSFAIKEIIASFSSIVMIDMLVSFMIPIVYLFLFIPVAYLFAIYARYESLFVNMSFKEPAIKKTRRRHRWEVFKACRFSYKKIDLFNKSYMVRMYVSMSDDSFRSLIANFKSKFVDVK